MKSKVQKWGNSLAVRIPKSFAEEMGWGVDAPVAMSLDEGALIIKTDRERAWDLDSLMAGVTDENIHPAWAGEGPAAEDAGAESDRDGSGGDGG
jgi:antitoxin MazE